MSIVRNVICNKDQYEHMATKDKSISIELKMIIDDGEKISPFTKMFSVDDFRDMKYKDIEEIIMENSSHIARTFALAILHREDCLNGKMD